MQAVAINRADKQWDLSASGGTLTASGWPTLQLDQATGSYQSAAITVSQAKLVIPAGGTIAENGALNLHSKRYYKFHGDLSVLSLTNLPPIQSHLHGIAPGSVDLTLDLAAA